MKKAKPPLPPPKAWSSLQDYRNYLSKKSPDLIGALNVAGLPPDGVCTVFETPGAYYGEKYKSFTVNSLAVIDVDVEADLSRGGIWYRVGDSAWRVWLMDVSMTDCRSAIRYIWSQSHGRGLVTIQNINSDLQQSLIDNGVGRAASSVVVKLKRLVAGVKIIEIEKARAGRRKGSKNTKPIDFGFCDDCADFRRKAVAWMRKQLESDMSISRSLLAKRVVGKTESATRRLLKHCSTSMDELKEQARSSLKKSGS